MNEILELSIERPVAGGRMLARHGGRVVFVSGTLPGERVRARVERASRQALWAATVDVLEPSADRRDPICDPACGGLAFAHITYGRQRTLKRDIIVDAFRRIGHLTLDVPPDVLGSPEQGYRLRARLHVRGGQIGFFREGTHDLCDASATAQLLPDALQAAGALLTALGPDPRAWDAVTVCDNIDATERVLHLDPAEDAERPTALPDLALPAHVTGVTMSRRGRVMTLAGRESVTDTARALFGGESPVGPDVTWSRRAPSFFQGNRFLAGTLVRRVLAAAQGDRVVDLYAGVGLFAVALAARGATVAAVEGDRSSGEDLTMNARPWGARLRVIHGSVEDAVRRPPTPLPDVVVLDPPRTGVSPAALGALMAWRAPRLAYVSCDPPTLARDAAKLVGAGYRLASLEAFDLFPNTPHVESVAVFDRQDGSAAQ